MKNDNISLYELHHQHKTWKNALQFYKDDIETMRHRLNEVTAKNTVQEVMVQVEHFENQFKVQRNNIDELNHVINISEDALQANIKDNPVAVDHRRVPSPETFRDQVESFEKQFNALRKEYILFLSKTM